MFNAPFPLGENKYSKANGCLDYFLACYLFGVKWSLYHVQFRLFYRFNPYFANLKLQPPCNFNKSIMQMNKTTEDFVNPF